jgi:hypothetical protein
MDRDAPLDPLRRVFVPVEKRTAQGTLVFRTTDKDLYFRGPDGSIRRSVPKVNGKLAKQMRRKQREEKARGQVGDHPER